MKLTPLYLLSTLLLGGCAAMIAPTPQEIATADYGPYPENYKEIVNDWIHKTFLIPPAFKIWKFQNPKSISFKKLHSWARSGILGGQ